MSRAIIREYSDTERRLGEHALDIINAQGSNWIKNTAYEVLDHPLFCSGYFQSKIIGIVNNGWGALVHQDARSPQDLVDVALVTLSAHTEVRGARAVLVGESRASLAHERRRLLDAGVTRTGYYVDEEHRARTRFSPHKGLLVIPKTEEIILQLTIPVSQRQPGFIYRRFSRLV